MTEVKWIKITVNMFEDEKMKLIENLPQGDTILVIWQKLICLAGKVNMNGYILLAENIPYTDEMLSITFNRPLPVIRLSLKTFENFSMIEIDEKGLIYLPNFEKHQNILGLETIREQGRQRVKKHREKSKLLLNQNNDKNVTLHVTPCNATDIDIEVDKNKKRTFAEKPAPKTIVQLVHKRAIEMFMNYYLEKTGVKYSFQGKDAKAIQSLLKQIKGIMKMEETEENLLSTFKFFLDNITDPWILSNLSVTMINSKFNEILNKIRNGNKGTRNTPDRVKRFIDEQCEKLGVSAGAETSDNSTPN